MREIQFERDVGEKRKDPMIWKNCRWLQKIKSAPPPPPLMFFFNFFDRDREEEEQRKDACRRPARSSVCSIFSGEETDGRLRVCNCSVRNCKEGIVCLKNLSFFSPRRERYFPIEISKGNLSRV